MAIRDALLPEFDDEMAKTRKILERVPEQNLNWKPHEKSMTLGRLASHLSDIPSYTAMTIAKESVDVAVPGDEGYKPVELKTSADLLEVFDKNVAEARAAIAGADDEHLQKPWSLLQGGKSLFTLPRAAVLRRFVFSHMIHHRAQLGVYLRLNDVPLPAIYGPSADENAF
jgi:uncharacterized damage-inducible protein DinB